MKITESKLRQIIREEILQEGLLEITRTPSLESGSIDYDDFTRWQKGKADEVDCESRERVGDLEIQWADGGETVRVIPYRGDDPIGFVVMNRFADGHSISTLGLASAARGGGVAGKLYDYIISRTRLYSDVHQTPQARTLWLKLSERHTVMGWQNGRTFEVVPSREGTELKSADGDHKLYSDEEGSETRLVIGRP